MSLAGLPSRISADSTHAGCTRCLIVGATEIELRPLLQYVTDSKRLEKHNLCVDGHVGATSVRIVETGPGKCNAALTAASLLAGEHYRAVIQTGCCGAFAQSGLAPGDVIVATRSILADEGVAAEDGFLDLEALGLPSARDADGTPIYNELELVCPLEALAACCGVVPFGLRRGAISTVSTCSGTDAAAAAMRARWSPDAEAMEGAGTALAALRFETPCLEVRGVSNLVGRRDRTSWQIDSACQNAARVVASLVANLDDLLAASAPK